MKKLIYSFFLLLISFTLLTTSTYAWFSMNTSVKASNIEIKATVSKNLLISSNNSTFSNEISLNIQNLALYPVSTIGNDTNTPSFFEVDNVGLITPNDANRKTGTTFKVADNNHYMKTTVYLKCLSENGQNLTATIIPNVNNNTAALNPAIRVMLVDKTNAKTYIYAPNGVNYITAGQAMTAADGSLAQVVSLATSGTTNILANLTADQVYEWDVYAWYEGEDAECKTVNAQVLESFEFDIQFDCA